MASPEALQAQIESRVDALVVPRTDPRDTFDSEVYHAGVRPISRVLPLISDLRRKGERVKFALDATARVVLHSGTVVYDTTPFEMLTFWEVGLWDHVSARYRQVNLMIPLRDSLKGSELNLGWHFREGQRPVFFASINGVSSDPRHVSVSQLQGLSNLLIGNYLFK